MIHPSGPKLESLAGQGPGRPTGSPTGRVRGRGRVRGLAIEETDGPDRGRPTVGDDPFRGVVLVLHSINFFASLIYECS